MGLRPNDIYLADGPGSAEEWTTDGVVDVTEPLGNETHMHLSISGIKLTGIHRSRALIKLKEQIKLALNLKHLHIFDAQSTDSI